ncbi:Pyridoxal phosphate homeostasis protein [compost metagenome]
MSIADNLLKYKSEIESSGIKLTAVSKNHPAAAVMEAYHAGQRVFGENLVQELVEKAGQLPADIQWHLIGHLQTNKVKYIAPFVNLIESVDSLKLLKEIDKQAARHQRIIDCLLQVYIADEDSKFGLGYDELIELLRNEEFTRLKHIRITGLMGIATNHASEKQTRAEFNELKVLFEGIKVSFFKNDSYFREISMGMSADYKLAIAEGSTMVRIGSNIFGKRVIQPRKQAKA